MKYIFLSLTILLLILTAGCVNYSNQTITDSQSTEASSVSKQHTESDKLEPSIIRLTDNNYCIGFIETVPDGSWVLIYEYNSQNHKYYNDDERIVLINPNTGVKKVLMTGSEKEQIKLLENPSVYRPILLTGDNGAPLAVFGYQKMEEWSEYSYTGKIRVAYLYIGGNHVRIGPEMFPNYFDPNIKFGPDDWWITLATQLIPYDDGVVGMFKVTLPTSTYFTYGQHSYNAFYFIAKINLDGSGEVIYGPDIDWSSETPSISVKGQPLISDTYGPIMFPVGSNEIVFKGVDTEENVNLYVLPSLRILPQVVASSWFTSSKMVPVGGGILYGKQGISIIVRVDGAWELGVRDEPATDIRILVYGSNDNTSKLLDTKLTNSVKWTLSPDHKKIIYIPKSLNKLKEINLEEDIETELITLPNLTIDANAWDSNFDTSQAYGPVANNGDRIFFAIQEGVCNNLYMFSRGAGQSNFVFSSTVSQEKQSKEPISQKQQKDSSEDVHQGHRLSGINYEKCISPCIESGECVEGSIADEEWWYKHMREKQEIINSYWKGNATKEEALLATIQQKLALACYERAKEMRIKGIWIKEPDPKEVLGEEYYKLYLAMIER